MAKEIRTIRLSPADQSKKFLTIHLSVLDNGKMESIEALVQSGLAMGLMSLLQEMQAKHKIPIPSNFRPQGPPNLTVVADD
jgi:hypothetical protein